MVKKDLSKKGHLNSDWRRSGSKFCVYLKSSIPGNKGCSKAETDMALAYLRKSKEPCGLSTVGIYMKKKIVLTEDPDYVKNSNSKIMRQPN